jgi:tetraacyldisaccharide 4'-kinase
LDDFQHRYIRPGLSILLVEYNRPVFNDILLPAGNLREPWRNASRANVIIVTKCPDHVTPADRASFTLNLKLLPKQDVYFTRYEYGSPVAVFPGKRRHDEFLTYKHLRKSGAGILLVTGIANPGPLRDFLEANLRVDDELIFPDHHNFTSGDIHMIKDKLRRLNQK